MPRYNSGWNTNQENQKNRKSRRSKKRIWILQSAFVLVLSTVLWRVYDVQKVYGKNLTEEANKKIDVSHTLLAPRGSILDAQGNQLAYDVPAYYVDMRTADVKQNITAVVQVLAPIFGTTTATLTKLLNNNAKWVRWPHPVTQSVKAKLEAAFKAHKWAPDSSGTSNNTTNSSTASKTKWLNDITFSPTEQRFYPFKQFAANTLGYVASNGKGANGIEYQYNKQMAGTNGTIQYKQDASGFPLPGTIDITKKAIPGDNVQLTLDETIQGYVETQMDDLVKKYQPEHAAIIVTNPQTGAVLGMSSRPTYNPNQYWNAANGSLSQNWAVSSTFEPGSTFKPFVLTAALATHSITLNQTFQSGHTVVDGHTINDWNWGIGWGTLTFQEALEKSSNVGFTKIALALGWPNLIHYMKLFGFLAPTGIDLPNEATSIIFPKSDRHNIQLATSGFGQGIAVTPLQQVAAMGAIANGGRLMRPYVVSKLTAPDGKVIKQVKPTVVRQNFIPKKVIHEVSHTMMLDVNGPEGIDTGAKIAGYDVAGKTGTAQIVNPKTHKYYKARFETSFIGFAPANDPKVEVYVTLYWPKVPPDKQWGSSVAIPAARNIIKEALQYYHIPPKGDVKSVATAKPTGTNQVKYVKTPTIVGLSKKQATDKLKSLGLASMFAGESGKVQKQWPAPGVEVAQGTKMYGLLQTSAGGKITVPNLTGLSLRDATNLLAAMSLNIAPSGTGYVVSQSIAAGTKETSGTSIPVTLKP